MAARRRGATGDRARAPRVGAPEPRACARGSCVVAWGPCDRARWPRVGHARAARLHAASPTSALCLCAGALCPKAFAPDLCAGTRRPRAGPAGGGGRARDGPPC